MASSVRVSSAAPDADTPWPRAMADSMEDLGNPAFFAVTMACASRGLTLGSAPYSADMAFDVRTRRSDEIFWGPATHVWMLASDPGIGRIVACI